MTRLNKSLDILLSLAIASTGHAEQLIVIIILRI